MWKKIKKAFEITNKFDPVYKLIPKFFRDHPLISTLFFTLLQLGIWWFYGNYVDNTYTANSLKISGPTDIDEFSFGFIAWGIFTPYIFWQYLSFCKIWSNLSDSLCEEKVVDCNQFKSAVKTKISSSYFLPSIILCVGVILFYFLVGIPAEIEHERVSFWFVSTFGKVMIGLYVAFNYYIFINFLLRSLILIFSLKNYFDNNGITAIHVYHVDKCGGFAPVGNLAMQLASIAVIAGIWAVGYSFLPLAAGGRLNFSVVVIVLYLAYLILVPLILVLLTKPVSRAMKRYKQEVVMMVSRKLQEELNVLSVRETGDDQIDAVVRMLKKMEEYQKLNTLYDHLDAMPESPIKSINLKRFTGFASIPAILGVVSFFADLFEVISFF